jgi:hypothetical protein
VISRTGQIQGMASGWHGTRGEDITPTLPAKVESNGGGVGCLGPPAHPRREKRKESFVPVEITGAWVRGRKGLGEGLFWGWFAPGPFDSQGEPFNSQDELKPRPPKERRRADPPFKKR